MVKVFSENFLEGMAIVGVFAIPFGGIILSAVVNEALGLFVVCLWFPYLVYLLFKSEGR